MLFFFFFIEYLSFKNLFFKLTGSVFYLIIINFYQAKKKINKMKQLIHLQLFEYSLKIINIFITIKKKRK